MRRPLRHATIWLAIVATGALTSLAAFGGLLPMGGVTIALGSIGATTALFGLAAMGFAAEAALGERRLRRGTGVIARWTVPPAEWAAFLDADARYAASQPAVRNLLDRRPADGRPVEVIVGAGEVLLDGAHHAFGGAGKAALVEVAWLGTPGAPDCVHLSLRRAGGNTGGIYWYALRIPVPAAAREAGGQVFHELRAAQRPPTVPLVLRRPGLTAAWGFGIWAAACAVALGGWLLDVHAMLVAGLVVAGIAWLSTAVLLGAALLHRAFGKGLTSGPSPPR